MHKYICPKGHKWEMENESIMHFELDHSRIVGRVLYCPYCLIDFFKEHLPAEEVFEKEVK